MNKPHIYLDRVECEVYWRCEMKCHRYTWRGASGTGDSPFQAYLDYLEEINRGHGEEIDEDYKESLES